MHRILFIQTEIYLLARVFGSKNMPKYNAFFRLPPNSLPGLSKYLGLPLLTRLKGVGLLCGTDSA